MDYNFVLYRIASCLDTLTTPSTNSHPPFYTIHPSTDCPIKTTVEDIQKLLADEFIAEISCEGYPTYTFHAGAVSTIISYIPVYSMTIPLRSFLSQTTARASSEDATA